MGYHSGDCNQESYQAVNKGLNPFPPILKWKSILPGTQISWFFIISHSPFSSSKFNLIWMINNCIQLNFIMNKGPLEPSRLKMKEISSVLHVYFTP